MRIWFWIPALAGLGYFAANVGSMSDAGFGGSLGVMGAAVAGIVFTLLAIDFKSSELRPSGDHGFVIRAVTTVLMLVLLVFGIWSFVDYENFLGGPSPSNYYWWWPQEISTFGEDIDYLFRLISLMILVMFVVTMGALVLFVWKYSARRQDKGVFSHGSHRLEMIWTAVPAVMLLAIAFSQMGVFKRIKFPGAFEGEKVFAEVWASQFDWRYRYPGPDGEFGTADDVETHWELVVPKDEKVVVHLRSRDVLHSFFVPMLRVKQDAVPGMTIPVWFEVDGEEHAAAFEGREDKSFDVICTELCGWGHYKMSGRVRVLSREDFDAWMEAKVAERFANGAPEEE